MSEKQQGQLFVIFASLFNSTGGHGLCVWAAGWELERAEQKGEAENSHFPLLRHRTKSRVWDSQRCQPCRVHCGLFPVIVFPNLLSSVFLSVGVTGHQGLRARGTGNQGHFHILKPVACETNEVPRQSDACCGTFASLVRSEPMHGVCIQHCALPVCLLQ